MSSIKFLDCSQRKGDGTISPSLEVIVTAFVDVARPSSRAAASCYDILIIAAGSLFLALAAQLSIPLGFTPVPLTMQTFAVLLMGALLGAKKGTAAVLLYLLEGALGCPFFAGGAFGVEKLIGPTGGYLVGFALATYCMGTFLEKGARLQVKKTLPVMALGVAIIHLCGMSWLAQFIGWVAAFKLGVLPFLMGDVIKIALAANCIPFGWKLLKS